MDFCTKQILVLQVYSGPITANLLKKLPYAPEYEICCTWSLKRFAKGSINCTISRRVNVLHIRRWLPCRKCLRVIRFVF
jgi:hypothetical protein